MYLDLRGQRRDALHDAQDVASPGLVALHGRHVIRRLDVQAAAVEGEPLPDEDDLPFCLFGDVGEMDQAGRGRRAASYCQQCAHPLLLQALFVPYLAVQPRLHGKLLGPPRQDGRIDDVAGLVGQLARRYLSGGELQPLRGLPGGEVRDGDLPEAEPFIVVLVLLLVPVEGVAAEPRGLGQYDGTGEPVPLEGPRFALTQRGEGDERRLVVLASRRAQRVGQHVADQRGTALLALAQPREVEVPNLPPKERNPQQGSLLSLEVLAFPQLPDEVPEGQRRSLRTILLAKRQYQSAALPFLRGAVIDFDVDHPEKPP